MDLSAVRGDRPDVVDAHLALVLVCKELSATLLGGQVAEAAHGALGGVDLQWMEATSTEVDS